MIITVYFIKLLSMELYKNKLCGIILLIQQFNFILIMFSSQKHAFV